MGQMIIDFETFGQEATKACPFEASVLAFDVKRFSEEGYTIADLNRSVIKLKLDVETFVKDLGFTIYKEGLEFWKKQNKPHLIKPNPQLDLKPVDFLNQLANYVKENNVDHWYSRSNTFDPIILWQIISRSDSKYESNFKQLYDGILPWWKVRDTRSTLQGMSLFQLKSSVFIPTSNHAAWNDLGDNLHDSKFDVIADVLRMQFVYRAALGLDEKDIFSEESPPWC